MTDQVDCSDIDTPSMDVAAIIEQTGILDLHSADYLISAHLKAHEDLYSARQTGQQHRSSIVREMSSMANSSKVAASYDNNNIRERHISRKREVYYCTTACILNIILSYGLLIVGKNVWKRGGP